MKLYQRLYNFRFAIRDFFEKYNAFYLYKILDDILYHEGHKYEYTALFYLPVYRKHDSMTTVYWILPLAPFIMAFLIIRNVLLSIWRDLLILNELIDEHNIAKVIGNQKNK